MTRLMNLLLRSWCRGRPSKFYLSSLRPTAESNPFALAKETVCGDHTAPTGAARDHALGFCCSFLWPLHVSLSPTVLSCPLHLLLGLWTCTPCGVLIFIRPNSLWKKKKNYMYRQEPLSFFHLLCWITKIIKSKDFVNQSIGLSTITKQVFTEDKAFD